MVERRNFLAEIKELQDKYDKLLYIIKHSMPERYEGTFFICGEGGKHDENGLPEQILVCPAYGVDIDLTTVYERVKNGNSRKK